MNADDLRARQAPLKQLYRDDPAAAQIPSRAEGELVVDDVACQVRIHKDRITKAGLHPAGGGSGEEACSADLLLEALVGCAGVTLGAVATAMGIPIRGGKVIAEGVWDARGTLGVDKTAPVGITDIKLIFEIDSDAEAEKIDKMIQLVERYCVIAQTLSHPPKLSFSHRRIG